MTGTPQDEWDVFLNHEGPNPYTIRGPVTPRTAAAKFGEPLLTYLIVAVGVVVVVLCGAGVGVGVTLFKLWAGGR